MSISEKTYIDHGNWAEGVNQNTGETIYVAKEGYHFALLYDFTKPKGEEFSGLHFITDEDYAMIPMDYSYLAQFQAVIGTALPEVLIWALKSSMHPLISSYREAFDSWMASESEDNFISVEERHDRLNDFFQAAVTLKTHTFPSQRQIGQTVRSYYENNEQKFKFLRLMISTTTSDKTLETLAIKEAFTNNAMFHPDDVYNYFLKYRDFWAMFYDYEICNFIEELA